jgi:hypothetical protein
MNQDLFREEKTTPLWKIGAFVGYCLAGFGTLGYLGYRSFTLQQEKKVHMKGEKINILKLPTVRHLGKTVINSNYLDSFRSNIFYWYWGLYYRDKTHEDTYF